MHFFEYEEPSIIDVWENCVVLSIQSIYVTILDVIVVNVIFSILTRKEALPNVLFHLISFILGSILLLLNVNNDCVWSYLGFLFVTYLFIYVVFTCRYIELNPAYVIGVSCISFLFLCECFYAHHNVWKEARGLFMVGSMKVISLSFDLHGNEIPSIIEFFGYACCPANTLLGPWIPFEEYISIRQEFPKKGVQWFLKTLTTVFTALFYLMVSNCWGSFIIPDSSNKWLLAYRQAQSFRTSHYFISYLSEAGMVAAGYRSEKYKLSQTWGYEITSPIDIEFPSSLSRVVVYWNITVHKFLKKYVYRVCLPKGNFYAIIATYLMSSLLHGFNIKIATVLLTLGAYSYLQYQCQEKLAAEFDSCLRVRPCKDCDHKYTKKNFFVKMTCFLFTIITVFHLTYLGVVMDVAGDPSINSIYSKWENLNFFSHFIMMFTYIIIIVV